MLAYLLDVVAFSNQLLACCTWTSTFGFFLCNLMPRKTSGAQHSIRTPAANTCLTHPSNVKCHHKRSTTSHTNAKNLLHLQLIQKETHKML